MRSLNSKILIINSCRDTNQTNIAVKNYEFIRFIKFPHTTFIVSRGLAKESTRVPRIFNRLELIIIDITS